MFFFLLGINHATAPVALREQLSFSMEEIPKALANGCDRLKLAEFTILSTCNRTELYCIAEVLPTPTELLVWLTDYHGLPTTHFQQHVYFSYNDDALRHLMRVSGGLDSMVIGEPQILGQVRATYEVAQHSGTIGKCLKTIFTSVFAIARKIRSHTAIGRNPMSVAQTAARLAGRIFSDLNHTRALFIGSGDTIETVMQHMKQRGINHISIAARNMNYAKELAQKFAAKTFLLSDLRQCLQDADIVISCTASQLPLIGKGMVEHALKIRRRRPIFMVDLAVPRDIEEEVATLPDVYLYNIDDLKTLLEEYVKQRQQQATLAETMIDDAINNFNIEKFRLFAQNYVKAYRQEIDEIREQQINVALQQINNQVPPEQIIRELAHNLTQKLSHKPSKLLSETTTLTNKAMLDWLSQSLLFSPDETIQKITNDDIKESKNWI